MEEIKIWHFSRNLKFPLKIKADGFSERSYKVVVLEKDLFELELLPFDEEEVHILVFQAYEDSINDLLHVLNSTPRLLPFIKVIIIPELYLDYFQDKLEVKRRIYVLDDQTKSSYLKILLEYIIKSERYRKIIQEFSTQIRKYREFLESYVEVIRKEILEAKSESQAYQRLLEFEQQYRVFEEKINRALEEAFSLKEKEMIELQSTIKAMEKLGEFRDKELMEARKTIEAAEIALEISRMEGIEREKMIDALQKLNLLSEAEIIELYKENQELRKKLGLPPRESTYPDSLK